MNNKKLKEIYNVVLKFYIQMQILKLLHDSCTNNIVA